ncbi:MAG: hypothetical protein M5U21_00180 [Fimbriimonadaceae bacterium]|nr:hypothetical protein [Fimbriimonadaceae bacterium]
MSNYPRLSLACAQEAYKALSIPEEPDWLSLVPDHETHLRNYLGISDAVKYLLSQSPDNPTKVDLREFEANLSECVHPLIPWGDHTGDQSFWRWVAFVPLREAVVYRHGGKSMPDKKNYGIGPLTENLAFRCWIRGDIACDDSASPFLSERYAWARVGDQDLWRSFLIRARYSYAREMAKALLEFQHPDKSETRTLRAGDKTTGIRMLSKRLSRVHANVCLAALSKDECLQLLSELADGLEMEEGGKYKHAGTA